MPPSVPLQLERQFVYARALGIVCFLAALALSDLAPERRAPVLGILLVAAAYTAGLRLALDRAPRVVANGYAATLVDTVLTAALAVVWGGASSPLYFAVLTTVLAAALKHGYGPSLAAACLLVVLQSAEFALGNARPDGMLLVWGGFPLLLAVLGSYVHGAWSRVQAALASRLDEAEQEVRQDRLTGLANGVALRERIDQRRESVSDGIGALLVLDLDRFKDINDTFGHTFGDQLLREVGQQLRNGIEAGGLVARLGGDEFAIFLPGASLADAQATVRAVASLLARPFTVQGEEVVASASLGIATVDGLAAEDAFRRADVAMYHAKTRRLGWAAYTAEIDPHRPDRISLLADLRRAFEREELRVHYQPIADLRTGAIVELEALVRWQHPTRGLLAPGTFVPLAEETGLIEPLGRWVLEEVCRQLQEWEVKYPGRELPIVGVNVSARQLLRDGFVDDVRAIFEAAGVNPTRVKLEITEAVAMEDTELVVATLWMLKGIGTGLALDDFGTGYSSLSYLKRFPLSTLKIDRSFVQGLPDSPEDDAIAQVIVSLARVLGLSTTAEGVETEAQRQRLRELGCDRAQGYLIGHPAPVNGAETAWYGAQHTDASVPQTLASIGS